VSPPHAKPSELACRLRSNEWVVDVRNRRAFAAGHLAGTVNVELITPFATYLGWVKPWGTPLTVIAQTEDDVTRARRALVRIGIDRLAAVATGGAAAWGDLETGAYRVADFAELAHESRPVVLDVRRRDEVAAGCISGSVHVHLAELASRVHEVPDGVVWVHCASGFRAAIAASLLDRAGRTVVLVDDDWERAEAAGCDVQRRSDVSARRR
jgi:rhodanese-related sulfurtransferase